MPGRDQCSKQTGSDIHARGDLRGRGTQIEYDRKGKYSLLPQKGNFAQRPYCNCQEEVTGRSGRSMFQQNCDIGIAI